MDRYAIIRDGKVANVCLWNGDLETWQPPKGSEAVRDDGTAQVGGEYANGTFSLASPEPQPVPSPVSARQLKLALLGANLLDNVDAFARQAGRAVEISWEYASEFHRDNALLNAMAHQFGMTEGQVDDLFRQAATL